MKIIVFDGNTYECLDYVNEFKDEDYFTVGIVHEDVEFSREQYFKFDTLLLNKEVIMNSNINYFWKHRKKKNGIYLDDRKLPYGYGIDDNVNMNYFRLGLINKPVRLNENNEIMLKIINEYVSPTDEYVFLDEVVIIGDNSIESHSISLKLPKYLLPIYAVSHCVGIGLAELNLYVENVIHELLSIKLEDKLIGGISKLIKKHNIITYEIYDEMLDENDIINSPWMDEIMEVHNGTRV